MTPRVSAASTPKTPARPHEVGAHRGQGDSRPPRPREQGQEGRTAQRQQKLHGQADHRQQAHREGEEGQGRAPSAKLCQAISRIGRPISANSRSKPDAHGPGDRQGAQQHGPPVLPRADRRAASGSTNSPMPIESRPAPWRRRRSRRNRSPPRRRPGCGLRTSMSCSSANSPSATRGWPHHGGGRRGARCGRRGAEPGQARFSGTNNSSETASRTLLAQKRSGGIEANGHQEEGEHEAPEPRRPHSARPSRSCRSLEHAASTRARTRRSPWAARPRRPTRGPPRSGRRAAPAAGPPPPPPQALPGPACGQLRMFAARAGSCRRLDGLTSRATAT